ncbi:MAG TPA: hypothetical protein VGH87_21835, partial [Polyangiaceae bacterium]
MRRKRVPNIVPPLVLSAAFVGVVPACALVSCGSSPTDQDVLFGGDVAVAFDHRDVRPPMGGDVASCCFGVADAMFDDVVDEPVDDDASDADEASEGGRD